MSMTLNPYLSFRGTAREAMEFYQQVFGGDLTVSTFGEFDGGTSDWADQIMHAQLSTPAGFTLMGADAPEGMGMPVQENGAVSLSGDDVTTLRGYFTALSEGGQVRTPLELQAWGDEYGDLVDRFGVVWLVNIAGSEGEGEAAGQASA